MTDKLQLMLINVLLDQFLIIKVSQGSVATRLRCDGICNDQFITHSLLSPTVITLKIVQHLPKLWATATATVNPIQPNVKAIG